MLAALALAACAGSSPDAAPGRAARLIEKGRCAEAWSTLAPAMRAGSGDAFDAAGAAIEGGLLSVPGVDTPAAEARAIATLYAGAVAAGVSGRGGGAPLRDRFRLVVDRGGLPGVGALGQCLKASGADESACVRQAWSTGVLPRPETWLAEVERAGGSVRCPAPGKGGQLLDDADFDVTPSRPAPAR